MGVGFDPSKGHDANSAGAIASCVGKVIECARMDGDELMLTFSDGVTLRFADRGQDCCERRYMTCDDDLQSFTGDRFDSAELLDGPDGDSGGDVHETKFLHIRMASGNVITCQTHNEHNGFYGGFNVVARVDT